MNVASETNRIERPPIVVTVLALVALVVLGLLLVQFVAGLIATVIRLVLVVGALYLMGRIGLYLLRKG